MKNVAYLFAVLSVVSGVWASTCSIQHDTAMSLQYYKNVRVSQSACCSLCTSDSRCRTAVYSPLGECYLVDAWGSAHPFPDRGWTLMTKTSDTIVDRAVATPDLSTLVTALKAGGLVKTLEGKGPFTVFAPTNEAFAKLPAATLKHLLDPANVKELDALLTYHVAAGAVFSKDIKDKEKIKTVEGQDVTASIYMGNRIFINNALVTTADVGASNGVIHIIDTVLSLPSTEPKTVVDLAVATPDLSTLVTALKAADLVSTLEGKGPFTVFAPTNEAFAKLPPLYLKLLLDPKNVKTLQKLLTYHVVAGSVFSKDIKNNQVVKTVEGETVTAHVSAAGIKINNSTVTTADVAAQNGVVHVIDTVLMPSGMDTIVDLAVATPDLSTLVTALKAADLVKTLEGKGPFTVFAPTNEAFAKLPPLYLKLLLDPKNVKTLQKLLTYHVVAGSVFSKDIKNNQVVKTVEGETVTAHVSAAGIKINNSTVTTADVAAQNGVVHVIDTVLMPSGMPPPEPIALVVPL